MHNNSSWKCTIARLLGGIVLLAVTASSGNWALLVMIENGLYSALYPQPYLR